MTDSTNSSTGQSAAALNSPEAICDNHVELGGPVELDEMSIRSAMNEFTTGATITTTEDEGEAYGFACRPSSSLGLTPPMVLFTVMKTSRSWPHIRNAGCFFVNVLAEDQEDTSATFGCSNDEKLKMGKWARFELGNPLLYGCSVWIDHTVVDVYGGSGHRVVTTDIAAIDRREEINPFIYHRDSYARASYLGTGASADQKWCQRPSA